MASEPAIEWVPPVWLKAPVPELPIVSLATVRDAGLLRLYVPEAPAAKPRISAAAECGPPRWVKGPGSAVFLGAVGGAPPFLWPPRGGRRGGGAIKKGSRNWPPPLWLNVPRPTFPTTSVPLTARVALLLMAYVPIAPNWSPSVSAV